MSDYAYETDTAPTTGGSQYVTAFFDSRADADAAIDRIVAEGVARDDIRMVEGNDAADTPAAQEDKGFFEALGDFFMPDEDRATYAEGLNRGGYLVSLTTTASNRDRILDILDDEGTVDMDEREESWRAEGWTADSYMEPGAMAGSTGMTGSEPRATGMAEAAPAFTPKGDVVDGTIEVVEEKLRVGKREVDHGRVRVRSYVVETPVEETVTLHDETIHVERNAVDRPLDDSADAFTDRTIEATETAEEAVMSKDARVVEEITLNKDVADRSETVHDTVRHTEVEIDDDRTDRTETTDRTKQKM
ncbi:YsnF/AvaK domain-containing protein [uncultured Jannaschia sp.]|uniref:YsnF/AvaK domain-containing protein n=1 Tax=uncultured Jannaschia sp. TaxID=293347 RepID=UPI002638A98F|nr:YsnF/AvaK domain-containing protein [uncultured Jannaschia sp.]